MYNRYIPGADGAFQKIPVSAPCDAPPPPRPTDMPCVPEMPPVPEKPCAGAEGHPLRRLIPKGMDTGDLLILAILLLLLIDGDEDDTLSVLLTVAAFLMM